MDIKEIALRLLAEEFPGMHQENQAFMVEFAEALIESYKAELLKEVQGGQPDLGEPVAWYLPENKQHQVVTKSLAVSLGKDKPVIHDGWIGLFTSDQVAAAILKATKPLEYELRELRMSTRMRGEDIDELRAQLTSAKEEIESNKAYFTTLLEEQRVQLAKAEQRVSEYNELIYAVQTKNPDETRHQTALRYIRNAENRPSNTAANGASS